MADKKEIHLTLNITEDEFYIISSALLECRNESSRLARAAKTEAQKNAYMKEEKLYDIVNQKIDSQVFSQVFGGIPLDDRKIKMSF